jgi:hypothetical protein
VCAAGDGNQLILDGIGAPRETVTLVAGECKPVSLGWNRPGPADLFASQVADASRHRGELLQGDVLGGAICTFWLCLALCQIGAREEALALFE